MRSATSTSIDVRSMKNVGLALVAGIAGAGIVVEPLMTLARLGNESLVEPGAVIGAVLVGLLAWTIQDVETAFAGLVSIAVLVGVVVGQIITVVLFATPVLWLLAAAVGGVILGGVLASSSLPDDLLLVVVWVTLLALCVIGLRLVFVLISDGSIFRSVLLILIGLGGLAVVHRAYVTERLEQFD